MNWPQKSSPRQLRPNPVGRIPRECLGASPGRKQSLIWVLKISYIILYNTPTSPFVSESLDWLKLVQRAQIPLFWPKSIFQSDGFFSAKKSGCRFLLS